MNLTLNFSATLTEQNITSIADQYGFAEKSTVEKFIMDFEMHHHITNEIECITRGGMCMPFHTSDVDPKRLSKDIDLLTSESIFKVKEIIAKIDNTLPEINCEEIIASNPYPLDNLISYRIYYDSCLGDRKFIKVDFFCDVNVKLDSIIVPSGYPLFAFNTSKDISILSKGALVGDKITTLALGTIGLKSEKQTEIAKQIYDIGVLIKSLSISDLTSSFQTFIDLTTVKINHFDITPKYVLSNILQSIDKSVSAFLNLKNAISIDKSQEIGYTNFQGTYLAKKSTYKKTEHVTNVLLIKLYAKYLRALISGTPIDDVTANFSRILNELNKIKTFDRDISAQTRSLYMQTIPDTIDFNKKILNSARLDHVFLLKEIYV